MGMETPGLFADQCEAMDEARPQEGAKRALVARVRMPNRQQMELRPRDLESLLPEGHRARLVWGYVVRQDLGGRYAPIKAYEGGAGRTPIAPEILFALWLLATLEGVGSARAIERLTWVHDAYRWIGGGVPVNYPTLADFRTAHGDVFDELLAENVASLMAIGVVSLARVAQDGVRVRASAGAASFRREEKLPIYLEEARKQVRSLKNQVDEDPGALTRKQKAARERAIQEGESRIEEALKRLPELAKIKEQQGKKSEEARASTTDAEATVMKMADGGFRPAYNVQYATDSASQVMVGIDAVTRGSDQGPRVPMLEPVSERCGQSPEAWLVDGGYPGHEQLNAAAEQTTVYAPVPKAKQDKESDPPVPKASDSKAVAAWRERMGTEEAKIIYRDRAATAECVNAQARNRGLIRLPVRGTTKVKAVALLFALAHNLMRIAALVPEWMGIGTGPSGVASSIG